MSPNFMFPKGLYLFYYTRALLSKDKAKNAVQVSGYMFSVLYVMLLSESFSGDIASSFQPMGSISVPLELKHIFECLQLNIFGDILLH